MIEQSIQMGKEVIVPAILSDRKGLASCRLWKRGHFPEDCVRGDTFQLKENGSLRKVSPQGGKSVPKQELVIGPYGVYQPEVSKDSLVNPEEIDLFIIPGLAFDAKGNRLGRGQGYYDRFLARIPRYIPRVGVAFRFQMVDDLPCDKHDQPVNRLVCD